MYWGSIMLVRVFLGWYCSGLGGRWFKMVSGWSGVVKIPAGPT